MKIFGIVGWKNSGKTGLMERLVADITARGTSVSTIKHAHHNFDLDVAGKDSFRHREAGAREVVLASRHRWALMRENQAKEPLLSELLRRMDSVDLVLIEGYKSDLHDKIETHRTETGQSLISARDQSVVAVASNVTHPGLGVPQFPLDDTRAIANFLLLRLGLSP